MLERKVIRPGEGARITFQEYVGGWRGYRSRTLIVRVPNSRSDTFRVADVITEGIQGQPQLTFDSREAAIAWKESHPEYANWNVGRINSTYNCIKIPLEDGSEAWLAESNFPTEGSQEWDRLVNLYPDYFRTGPGFFRPVSEDMNGTWDFYTEAYEEYPVQYNTIYKVNDQHDNRLVVKLPNTRRDTFEIGTSSSSITKFRDILFLTQQEALDWLQQHGINGRTIRNTSDHTAWTNLVRVPLSDGSVVYMSKFGLPQDPDDGGRYYFPGAGETEEWCRNFWEKARRIYPEYFSTHRLGFFREELNLTEAYNVPHETFKRVIIKYVHDNGYIKGGWNGRYMTSSPTVDEINRILRHTDDLTDYMCTPEEYTEFDTWVRNLTPEGPQADWMNNCINSWDKTGNLETQDLKNLVSFVSYHDSNIKFQRHQQEIADRERRHQEYVNSDANTWVGNIGDTIEFTVAEAKISGYVNPPSYYARSYPMWKIVDTDGHTYSWGDTKDSVQIEPGMIVKGKVKDHTEFRGVKQTKIWKIEISTPSRLGFFKENIDRTTGRINLQVGDVLKTHGDGWRSRGRSRDDFEWTLTSIEPSYTSDNRYLWEDCHFIQTNLNTHESITYGMSLNLANETFNREGFVFEYNGRPYPPEKPTLGFFKESINRELTGQEIKDIMEDSNLSTDEKCRRLFDRPEEYVVLIQSNFLALGHLNKYTTKEYQEDTSESIRRFNQIARTIMDNRDINRFGVCSVFFSRGYLHNVEESYNAYVRSNWVCNGCHTEQEKAHAWWYFIKKCIEAEEDAGLVTCVRLGFFH